MSKLDKDTVIENFTKAYTKAHSKEPNIEANGGWYSVDGGKNMRLAQLDEMTSELQSSGSGDKKAAETKTETKTKTKSKKETKPATKKKTNKKAKPGTFSVKDFYTQQIIEANPSAKAPR